jgi:protein TonB
MKFALPRSISALSYGILGRDRNTLAPSTLALGPNIYLSSRDFLWMLVVAFAVHALAFAVMALWPEQTVKNIPVRALSFKLGDGERLAAAPAMVATPAPAPVVEAISPPVMQATEDDSWRAEPKLPAPVVPEPLKPIAKPKPKPKPEKREFVAKPAPAPAPAIADNPQQYVREVGAAPTNAGVSQGAPAGVSVNEQALQAIRARYEQQISAWVQRHKIYPAEAGGREGRAIVRVRIDRLGNVRYYAIEQSAGLGSLDAAALDMIRRANPMPAVPADYPDGNLVEFLIPISFRAPQ